MDKGRARPLNPVAEETRALRRSLAPARRTAEGEPPQAAKNVPARSAAIQLAAEVERLRAELAAAQTKMAELEARADIDPLLGLLNRRGFERELRRSLAYVRRYGISAALLYLDLDQFKPVNDRYGHAAGDCVLQAVVGTLHHTVRESDVVARLGGDEFAVLLWNVNEGQASAKAEQLEKAVSGTMAVYDGVRLSVGISAGCAMLLADDTPADVITRADLAMYKRKHARR